MPRGDGPDDALLGKLSRHRIAIENVSPEIDAGRFAAKGVAGRPVEITADVFGDGHEVIGVAVLFRKDGSQGATAVPMTPVGNDRWQAEIVAEDVGAHHFTISAWRDLFGTWHHDTSKKVAAGLDVSVEIEEARGLLKGIKAKGADARALQELMAGVKDEACVLDRLMSPETHALMNRIGPRANETIFERELPLWIDRERAVFGAWYELFPRSMGPDHEHGTFDDVIGHLPYVRDLGFDTLYFPPIHPIGETNRKGRNNSLKAEPGDVGSPYAIGSNEGGFRDVHPDLGTMEDFDRLVAAAREHGLEIAIDVALNASPDHPWIREHPDWFERRPDGTIKYAENPPKKYEDIVNFRYYIDDGPNLPLWHAIRDMFLFWADRGVLSFRVDNPHTKPFPFWEWIIAEVRKTHPETIFLSEAFTRPKVMKRLAKVGFNQSYTYYTWRSTKAELTEYLEELVTSDARHVMRPNFFVNTPDINPFLLQYAGRPGFLTRLVMAASLSGAYGVYSGYELCEAEPLPGREEYLHSEKYEIKNRDFDAEHNIKDDIRLMNRIRHEQPAMRDYLNLRFYAAQDDRVLYYGRMDEEAGNFVLFHVLIDPHEPAEFGFEVPLWEFGLPDEASVEVEDLIHGNSFTWHGKHHRLALDPHHRPYAIWRITPPGGGA